MSSISGLGGGAPRGSSPSGLSGLSSDEFMGLVLTELSNQDPLQPNETRDLLEQISTIRSIQADDDLMQRLETIVEETSWASSASLIGRQVGGVSPEGRRVEGSVASVLRTRDGVVLLLDSGARLSLSNVDRIDDRPAEPEPGSGAP